MTAFFRTSMLLFGILTFGAAASAKADIYDLDRLAMRLEAESATLFQELSSQVYDGNLRVASGEVLQLHRQAGRIHALIHRGVGLAAMHAEVSVAQDLIDDIHEHLAGYRHYDRHVHRLGAIAEAMDDQLHLAASGVQSAPQQPVYQPAYQNYQPSYNYGYRNTATFGKNGLSIRIGR
jgi:hypothetical protein